MARFAGGTAHRGLTAELARKLFHYDPETGALSRRVPTLRSPAGTVVRTPCANGYLQVNTPFRPYLIHRVAWLIVHGEWPHFIDHINHDRSDNRLCNLREVSRCENMRNQKINIRNSSGVLGVCWDAGRNKWMVRVKKRTIGRYSDFFEAVCARKSAESRLGFHQNHGRAA